MVKFTESWFLQGWIGQAYLNLRTLSVENNTKMRIYFLSICLVISTGLIAQKSITYELDLSNIEHHELGIKVKFSELTMDTLEIRMPNASPGRYALHNFAKNVYNESAKDANSGKEIAFIKSTPFSWKIPLNTNGVIFEYTLFGNHADGTYVGIDASKLHLNMPATFVYGANLADRKIELQINLDDYPEWSVGTQLVRENDTILSAPNYYYFYDSPVVVGEIVWRRWQVDNQTIEVAMIHEGNNQELDNYVSWIKQIILQEKAVFGELPKYDYGRYTFLCEYNPWASGGAMEHRNSTVCSSQGNLAHHAPYLIGSIAHEFFHGWNIERIRPKSLEPFNFDGPNQSEELWFGEGFTNYYDELSMCRAGVINQDKFLSTAENVLNKVMNSPGRSFRNPIQMSQNAIFVDAGTANDQTNYDNNYISYYTYGELLGLALDLSIRNQFSGLSLDDYLKLVWKKYGQPEIPYNVEDLRQTLGELTNDQVFANAFFDQYIYDSQLPDFKSLYNYFGISVALATPGKIYTGKVHIDKNNIITSKLIKGTALYEAGLNDGDRIISVSGVEIKSENDLERVFSEMEPGKSYAVSYEQTGKLKSSKFTAIQNPTIKLSYDAKASKASLKKRNDWLGAK